MKRKVKKLLPIIITVLIIIGVGSLLAYLIDTDEATNVFTAGKVDIELTETNWNSSNGQNVVPGQPINKNPAIHNIGNNPAYVYIKVVNPIVELTSGEGVLFNYTINSGWTQLDQKESCGYRATTYYYNNSLNPSNLTNALFDNVTVNEFTGSISSDQLLDVYAYGIQSTYLESGKTVSTIFSDSFTTGLSDTDESCPTVIDCSNNELPTTVPNNLQGLAKIMAKNAYLDNGKSEYVNSCSGVDFSNISSDTNGKGIYEIASTKNDAYPIYYYRGAVDNNNVKFGGFCWKAIRTTDTGGVKMIYNGQPDGSGNCTNTTGTSTRIGKSTFNSNYSSPTDVGYMYGTRYTCSYKRSTDLATAYIYGGDVTYSGGTYTLTDTMTSTGTWSSDYNTLNNNHYTCFSTSSTCTIVYYVYYTSTSDAYYITLTNGKKLENALDEMFTNTTNSTVKTEIDNWYNTNLSSHTSYIEDTIYCNDRSISELNGWNPDGGDTTKYLYFSPYTRAWTNHTPSLECSRTIDRFTVSSSIGNGDLTYPVGLITSDEVMYAGGYGYSTNNTYYLYTNQLYWVNSPYSFNHRTYNILAINSSGSISSGDVNSTNGLRPVISLSPNVVISSGDGTSSNPYTVKTN